MRDKYIDNIMKSLAFKNANRLTFENCYNLCANKNKLDVLSSNENQVIFGRRGTGKTTLLKAFKHKIEAVDKKDGIACIYIDLHELFPSDSQWQIGLSKDDIVIYVVKEILNTILDNLRTRVEIWQDSKKRYGDNIEIYKYYYDLEELILNGKPVIVNRESKIEITSTKKEINEDGSGVSFNIGTRGISINGGKEKQAEKERDEKYETNESQNIRYLLDVKKIRESILKILEIIGVEKLYLCIDEYTQIDKDIEFSIQPKVAQLLKQLFFVSEKFVVKIASVWNENRMQSRQTRDGKREGLEIGHDIYSPKGLKLDEMFFDNNYDAEMFFKTMILNEYLVSSREEYNDRAKELMKDDIVNLLFVENSFKYIICGSQGIPRTFTRLLSACLEEIKNEKDSRITPEIIFKTVISDYNETVRSKIIYDASIFKQIDLYVSEKKKRFFLVDIDSYRRYGGEFEGFVALEALQQASSEELPRNIKNNFKLFYVHYGNYLEVLAEEHKSDKGSIKQLHIDTTKEDGVLFPRINDVDHYEKYVLSLENIKIESKEYCTICRNYFNINDMAEENTCPSCGKVISINQKEN